MTASRLTPVAALVTLLAACGGGGNDAPASSAGAGSSAAATNITTVTPAPTAQSTSTPASAGSTSTSTSTSSNPPSTNTGSSSPTSGTSSSGTSTGGSSASGTGSGTNGGDDGSGATPTPTTTDRIAMLVALPMPAGSLAVVALADKGHAGGQVNGTPFTVSERNAAVANTDNFYTGESTTTWTTQVGGMNADGVLAGVATIGPRTFGWTWNGAAITKFEPPDGFAMDNVVGPSNDGRVAATLRPAIGEPGLPKAVIYGGGAPTDIPTLVPLVNGERPFQLVQAMSGNGTVMGITKTEFTGWERIFTYNAGVLRDLGQIIDCNCSLVTVNDNGYVLGAPRKMGPTGMLFNGTDRILIGAPKAGNFNVNVYDSNDRNDVVGSYWPVEGGDSKLLVFIGGQSYDLNEYTQADKLGWTLNSAGRINNNRQILGEGTFQGERRWYRLTLR